MRNSIEFLFGGKGLLIALFTVFTLMSYGQQLENAVQRKGFVIGLSVGAGVISIADSDAENPFYDAQGGIIFPNLKIGWMLNERMALLATFPGKIYDYEGKDRSFESIMLIFQYWVNDRWWVNAGFGLAMDFPAFYEVDDFKNEEWNFGCAVAASTGYEIYQKKNFTIDLQTKVYLGRVSLEDDRHRDAVAFTVGIGFNWY